MKTLPFKKIDAFADAASPGNPAAAVYLESESGATEADMLRIARELKGFVSEVGFAWPLGPDLFRLRYFSSEREVEFCGHATIAILHDLVSNDPRLRALPSISIQTNKARLQVENRIPSENAVFIASPSPVFSPAAPDVGALAKALGARPEALHATIPVSIVNAGLQTLVVPFNALDDVLSLSPSLDVLNAYCKNNAVDIVAVFSEQTSRPAHRLRSRVFAPTFGYLEDPATGSGNAAIGHDLLRNGRWDGRPISIEQNGSFSTPNIVRLAARPSSGNSPAVLFGGGAIVRIHGHYLLP